MHPLPEFVAGPENLLAVSALQPYLDRTTTHGNPLVLYGPHGSGKSHLAHGLAAWWRQHFPSARVACLAASEFAHAYAAAIQDQQLETFRRQIREVALFILDDLGQLSGKREAQRDHLLRARHDGRDQRADPASRRQDRAHHHGRLSRPARDRPPAPPAPL